MVKIQVINLSPYELPKYQTDNSAGMDLRAFIDSKINIDSLETKVVNKVNEGSPHVEDLIENKQIQLVINTTSGEKSIADSFSIRRCAIRNKIPYFTTISAAKVAITGLNLIKQTEFSVKPIQELHK